MRPRLTPFMSHGPVDPAFFVERDEHLRVVMGYLLNEGMNVNISGIPGIGKTSFLLKLKKEIESSYPDNLVIHVNLLSFVERENVDLARFFLLTIADALWHEVFNSPYSELLEILGRPDPVSSTFSKDKRTFLRIYRLLRSSRISSQIEQASEVGGNLVISGKRGEKSASQYVISDLYPFEFSRLLDELLPLLEKAGRSRIIILADESNYLNDQDAVGILRRNFDILLDRRIRYVFVTFEPAKNNYYESDKILHVGIRLEPFDDRIILEQLVDMYCSSFEDNSIKFTTKALDEIWKQSEGHPRVIQSICRGAWLNAAERVSTEVEFEDVESVS